MINIFYTHKHTAYIISAVNKPDHVYLCTLCRGIKESTLVVMNIHKKQFILSLIPFTPKVSLEQIFTVHSVDL